MGGVTGNGFATIGTADQVGAEKRFPRLLNTAADKTNTTNDHTDRGDTNS